MNDARLGALREWIALLPSSQEKRSTLLLIEKPGLDPQPLQAELRIRNREAEVMHPEEIGFLNLQPDQWDGIYLFDLLFDAPPLVVQRVLGILFRGFKPGGILALRILDRTGFQEMDASSLIRQSGFEILKKGRFENQILWLLKRISP